MIAIRIPAVRTALLLLYVSLAGCGGGAGSPTPVRSFATGPVHSACLQSDQRAVSNALCGCVQASANVILSRNEQARAVAFFRDPNLAQVTRQSDRAGDERFWQKYRLFVETAERSCA